MKFIFIFCFFSFSLLGQSKQYRSQSIDSLKELLNTETQVELRLKILEDLYGELKFKDPSASKSYAEQVLNEGQTLAPIDMTLNAEMHLASLLKKEGKIDSSNQILLEVIKNSKKLDYNFGQWKSYMILGNNLDVLGDEDAAFNYFKLGYAFHKKLKDTFSINRVKAIFSTNIANHLLEKDSLDECLEYFKVASEAANALDNPNMVGVIYNNIGSVYRRMKQSETALEYYKKSIHLRDSIGNKGGVLYATKNLLNVYDDLGKYEVMQEEGSRALKMAKEMEAPHFIVGMSNLLALAEVRLGNPLTALEILKPLEFIIAKNDINVDALLDYHNSLYTAHFEIGNYKSAEYHLLECEALHEKLGRTNSDKILLEKKIYLDIKLNNTSALDSNFAKYNLLFEKRLNEKFDKLGEIEAQYTNLENEKKVAFLEKDKELISAVSSRNKLAAIGGGLLALLAFVFLYQTKKKNGIIESNNKQLSALNNTKNQIFSIIGHDLKKPAIAFRGITEKLRYLIDSGDKERLMKYGESVEKDALELNNLTDNLLSWALLQKDLITFKEEKINLAKLSSEVVNLFSNVAKEKKITLSTDIQNVFVNSDKNALATVLRNLVDNALKYTGENGHVILSAQQTGSKVELLVKDDGQGIQQEKLPNLFALAQEKSTQGTSGEKGTGLGLHIVKDLVEKCKGTINVESILGEGTTFRVALPV